MPTELGIGIAVRQATKGKKIINLLHSFGVSVAYERLQKLETQKAKTVLTTMQHNDGVYIPAEAVLGRHIFLPWITLISTRILPMENAQLMELY